MAKVKKEAVVDEDQDEGHPFLEQQRRMLSSDKYKGTHYSNLTVEDINNNIDDLIPTGSTRMDILLGGGYRPGVSMFFGDEETGKTAQGLSWGREWQNFYKEKGKVIFIDAEGRLKQYKRDMSGIDTHPDRFFHHRSNEAEAIFEYIEDNIFKNPMGYKYFFVLDSLDALIRQEDKAKSFKDPAKVAGAAALNSIAFKRLSAPINCLGHHLYLITQMRTQNMMGGRGDSAKPSGGKAPKFYGDIIGRFYKGWSDTFIKDGSSDDAKIIGNLTKIKLTKTYNETSNQDIDIPILNRHKGGVWREYEAMLVCLEWSWINKGGAWYAFSDMLKQFVKDDGLAFDLETKIQGEQKVLKFFTENPDFTNYVLAKVRALSL